MKSFFQKILTTTALCLAAGTCLALPCSAESRLTEAQETMLEQCLAPVKAAQKEMAEAEEDEDMSEDITATEEEMSDEEAYEDMESEEAYEDDETESEDFDDDESEDNSYSHGFDMSMSM